jgi:signal transduction histidine kinase
MTTFARFRLGLSILCVVFLFAAHSAAFAASAEEQALAKESEAKCLSTVADSVTPQLIMKKIKEAVALVEKDGKKSFSQFKGKNSPFIFSGTYIWIHKLDSGVMLMHPVKPMMVGQKLIGLKDGNGKRFFVEMNQVVRAQGEGWVEYVWPKPGETKRSNKISYVHKAMCDGEEVVLGCGIYDKTKAEITDALKQP